MPDQPTPTDLPSLDSAGPPVFLVPPGSVTPRAVVTLDGLEGHHAAAVRRLRAGERADVSDGAGTLASCVVESVGRDTVDLLVGSVTPVPPPSPAITVVQALPKGDRGELAVEVMTEVGVDSMVAWQAARCVARWEGTRGEKALGKWQRTAREAAKQSRRAWIPSVTGPAGLDDVRRLVSGAECAVVLEASAAVPLSRLALPGSGSIVLIVGPEGGITPDERAALVAAGALETRLGPTVLRTSTAGAAAAAVLLTRSGRWLSRGIYPGDDPLRSACPGGIPRTPDARPMAETAILSGVPVVVPGVRMTVLGYGEVWRRQALRRVGGGEQARCRTAECGRTAGLWSGGGRRSGP